MPAGCGSWMTTKSKSSSKSSAFCFWYFFQTSPRSRLHWLAPWRELCIALVTVKKRSVPCITCHSHLRPRSRISGTRVPSSSATPPPKAVALRWRMRAPFSSLASWRISVAASSPMIRSYCRNLLGSTGTAENIALVYGTGRRRRYRRFAGASRRPLQSAGTEEPHEQPQPQEEGGGEHHQSKEGDVEDPRSDGH